MTVAALGALWQELDAAFTIELAESRCGVQEFLQRRNPAWNLVGRVPLHLAESRQDPEAPFAFLATYTSRLSAQAKPQHLPLGQALREICQAQTKGVFCPRSFPCSEPVSPPSENKAGKQKPAVAGVASAVSRRNWGSQ